MSKKLKHIGRSAVTLIEVVFAIGVILIGLLGLLSILPLAGRRAQDAIDLNVGSVMGEQVLKELKARQYLSSGRLKPLPANTSNLPLSSIPNLTADTTTSFCIDPVFASSSQPPIPPASAANTNGCLRSVFPFYRPDHNPLIDPSTNSINWPTPPPQPRMVRVGIVQTNNAAEPYLSTNEALAIAESADDLLVSRPDDRTRDATFKDGELTAIQGGLEYGARIPRGDFTWMATVNPLQGGVYASVSIVVLKKRERNFAVPTGTTPADSPQGNAIGERIAYVTYASGFDGGAGGVVHLVSSISTVPSIRSNDWIMLSRNLTGTTSGPIVHRWYRVMAVSNEPELFTTDGTSTSPDSNLGAPLPNGPHKVWRHKVWLDGSDWHFGYQSASGQYADNTFADNTYATIVSDVVSVTERVVLMSDL